MNSYLTQDERARLLAVAADHYGPLAQVLGTDNDTLRVRLLRDYAIAMISADARLRPREIVELNRTDLSPDAATVTSHAVATTIASPLAREVLLTWEQQRVYYCTSFEADQQPDITVALFVTRQGRRIGIRMVERIVRQIGGLAGLRLSSGFARIVGYSHTYG